MAKYGIWTPISQYVNGVPKWTPSRGGRRITAVVIHRMDGTLESSDSWLKSSASGSASTHFGVGLWNGTPQIRQWVDTAYTAWGWSARPTDTPTALAKTVLYPDIYNGSADLNWQVIAVEVEGWHYQSWNSYTKAKVIELLRWIYRTHGNLYVMAHTDISWKPCPGMTTFKAALPGYYGNRLGSIFSTLPNTSTGTTTSSTYRVGGLPVNFTNRTGWKATIKAGKPRRSGASLGSTNYGNTDSNGEPFTVWGEVVGQNFGYGSRWFFGPQYIAGKQRIAYIPLIDLSNRNF